MLINPNLNNEFKDSLKGQQFVSYDSGKNIVRIDSIYRGDSRSLLKRSGESIYRTTHFGRPFIDGSVNINDFIYTEMDAFDCSIIGFESSIVGSARDVNPRAEIPYNYIGPSLESKSDVDTIMGSPIVDIDSKMYINTSMRSNHDVSVISDYIEDELNLPYGNTLGPIILELTKCARMLPFEALFIIDSRLGINVHKLDIPKYNTDLREKFAREIKVYIDELKNLSKIFFWECNKFDKDLHIYIMAHVDNFRVKVNVVNEGSFGKVTIPLEYNLSDHCRVIRHTEASYIDGEFFDSEYMEVLDKDLITKCSAFDYPEEKDDFMHGYLENNYITSLDVITT